jgi:hypothetical protein
MAVQCANINFLSGVYGYRHGDASQAVTLVFASPITIERIPRYFASLFCPLTYLLEFYPGRQHYHKYNNRIATRSQQWNTDRKVGPGMSSNSPDEQTQICYCGRTFLQPGALKKHQRSCTKNKKRLRVVLEKVKEAWISRKRRRMEDTVGDVIGDENHTGQTTTYVRVSSDTASPLTKCSPPLSEPTNVPRRT